MGQPSAESDGTEALAVEYYRLAGEIEELQRRLEPVEQELLARMKDGDEIDVPGTRRRLRRRSRGVLDPDKLQEHPEVSQSLWNSITRRVPFAPLMKVAVHKGKLKQKTIDECSKRSKPWLSITK